MDGECTSPVRKHPGTLYKYARKLAFAKFVQQHTDNDNDGRNSWTCCDDTYHDPRDFHRHVAKQHAHDIQLTTEDILLNGSPDAKWKELKRKQFTELEEQRNTNDHFESSLPHTFNDKDEFPWLPLATVNEEEPSSPGQVLLFYKYRWIRNTQHVYSWQKELCQRLGLTGKVRVGEEGINVTVAGTVRNTETYITAVRSHPLFSCMLDSEFKRSLGDNSVFPHGLKVGIYEEIVPMGVKPEQVSYENTGKHLTVDEFHEAIERHLTEPDNNTIFIDCRNFYESKIGQFEGALCPDIRKFSYWPEYVERNRKLFENRKVYMYCTGGIRCERGSAYIINKGITDEVYQLDGGIHKYIEKFPEGHFRGKLFVFDDRYHISSNDDVISSCCYCGIPWYQYAPCTSDHCHQLVLSCAQCRLLGLTACCQVCQTQDRQTADGVKEECDCTRHRDKIPIEHIDK